MTKDFSRSPLLRPFERQKAPITFGIMAKIVGNNIYRHFEIAITSSPPPLEVKTSGRPLLPSGELQ